MKTDCESLTETKFINANSQDVFIHLEDKDVKFTVPVSVLAEQMASRISHNTETGEYVLKTLPTGSMKPGEGTAYVNLSMLDSTDKPREQE